jgi:hypothetical protein
MPTAIQSLTHDDAERERKIEEISARIVQLGACPMARVLARELSTLVKARSPQMVARLERERGLA